MSILMGVIVPEDKETDYGTAIKLAFEYLLDAYPEVFVIGQGLWSPWYVGNSMVDLDKKFGQDRVIDSPVSESAITGIGVGAAIAGFKPVVVHPRMDFMLYAMDAVVNQAAKWSFMFGGQASAGLTIRAIINRGGEQGAQHSQALHSWFAHIPGLRVVMPYAVSDARDLLIASVLSPDPVIYIDDRWLYENVETLEPISEMNLSELGPKKILDGDMITIVGSGYSTQLALDAGELMSARGIFAEVIDLRLLNPINAELIISSVQKTGRLLVVDGGWSPSGISAEIISRVVEVVDPKKLIHPPVRITLPFCPAPTATNLELAYYPSSRLVFQRALEMISQKG